MSDEQTFAIIHASPVANRIRIGARDVDRLMKGDWYVLYREKMGIQPKKPFAESIHSQLGLLSEPLHITELRRATHCDIQPVTEDHLPVLHYRELDSTPQTIRVAQIDAWDKTGNQPVELKFPHHTRWFDDRLAAYWNQLQWQMYVTASPKMIFSCMWIDRIEWRQIEADYDHQETLREVAADFEWRLIHKKPPARMLNI